MKRLLVEGRLVVVSLARPSALASESGIVERLVSEVLGNLSSLQDPFQTILRWLFSPVQDSLGRDLQP